LLTSNLALGKTSLTLSECGSASTIDDQCSDVIARLSAVITGRDKSPKPQNPFLKNILLIEYK